MDKRGHKIDPNDFCYVCAQFVSGSKRNFTATLQEAYWKCFKTSCSDVEKQFTPSFICSTCHRNLYRYNETNDVKLPFRCPAIWTDYSSHEHGVCYFCSIEKPSLKRKANYFDCASCKIPKVDLPDLADHPDVQPTASDSQSSEGRVARCPVFNRTVRYYRYLSS
jgi:hypothetical protein